MRMWAQSLALLGGLRIRHCCGCGIGHRCGLDPVLLCLWHRLAAAALIQPLAWLPPCATGTALKRKKKQKRLGLRFGQPKHQLLLRSLCYWMVHSHILTLDGPMVSSLLWPVFLPLVATGPSALTEALSLTKLESGCSGSLESFSPGLALGLCPTYSSFSKNPKWVQWKSPILGIWSNSLLLPTICYHSGLPESCGVALGRILLAPPVVSPWWCSIQGPLTLLVGYTFPPHSPPLLYSELGLISLPF